MKPSTRTFIAFLSGIAVGAAAGILFAPDSGKNTRDKLSYKLDKYLTKLREMLGQEKSGENFSESYTPADISRQDRKKAEDLLKEVESLLDDIKQNPQG